MRIMLNQNCYKKLFFFQYLLSFNTYCLQLSLNSLKLAINSSWYSIGAVYGFFNEFKFKVNPNTFLFYGSYYFFM